MSTFEETVDKAIEVAVARAVSSALLKAHPVGSIYLTLTDSNPSSLFGGTWEKVGSGKCLWLADSSHGAGTTIDAGLPNITGKAKLNSEYRTDAAQYNEGALSTYSGAGARNRDGDSGNVTYLKLDASQSNSIYGSSTTVQPPAYVVIAWKRTA